MYNFHSAGSLFSALQAGLLDKLKARAATRKLDDLTIGPVLTWTTKAMLEHMDKLLQLPGEGRAGQGQRYECYTITTLLPCIQSARWECGSRSKC
jgi:1-pyrroline-5-carboxylate dehydrogenase